MTTTPGPVPDDGIARYPWPSDPLLGNLIISPMSADPIHEGARTSIDPLPTRQELAGLGAVGVGQRHGDGLHAERSGHAVDPVEVDHRARPGEVGGVETSDERVPELGRHDPPHTSLDPYRHTDGPGRLDHSEVIGIEDDSSGADRVDLDDDDVSAGDLPHPAVTDGTPIVPEVLEQP